MKEFRNRINILFVGGIYQRGSESHHLSLISKGGLQMAVNSHQWSMIQGMSSYAGVNLQVLSAPYLPTFPNYKKIIINKSISKGLTSIGYINLPLAKEFIRTTQLVRSANKWKKLLGNDNSNRRIVICYYLSIPQLLSTAFMGSKFTKVLVIPDMPEFLNLSMSRSKLSKSLSGLKAKLIKYLITRFDKYIIVTKYMAKGLNLRDGSWIVSEGMVNDMYLTSIADVKSRTFANKDIVYAGGLHEQYGLRNLLDAMKHIKDEDAKLIIFGDGEMVEEVRDAAKKDSRIVFHGYKPKEEVDFTQRNARVLINPRGNNHEYVKYSFPSKNLEYLNSGTPVVCCKLDCIPDYYDDIFTYSPDDSATKLALTIESILNMNESDLRELSLKGLKFIYENKSSNIEMHRVLDFIKKS